MLALALARALTLQGRHFQGLKKLCRALGTDTGIQQVPGTGMALLCVLSG